MEAVKAEISEAQLAEMVEKGKQTLLAASSIEFAEVLVLGWDAKTGAHVVMASNPSIASANLLLDVTKTALVAGMRATPL